MVFSVWIIGLPISILQTGIIIISVMGLLVPKWKSTV